MRIEPVHADRHSLEDTELNHLAIWTLYSMASVVLIGTCLTITGNETEIEKSGNFKTSFFLLYMLVFEFCL